MRKTMKNKLTKTLAAIVLTTLILSASGFAFPPIYSQQTFSVPDSFALPSGEGDVSVHNEASSGLNTTSFDTLVGTVTVNLPDDLSAGDTISGTVISETKGKTSEEQAKN